MAERKFLDIDIDNFDERMRAIQPRVAFAVPNTLSDQGQLMVDITFESIDDFSPAAIARKVESLSEQALVNVTTMTDDACSSIEVIIAEINRKLSEQINLVLHRIRIDAKDQRRLGQACASSAIGVGAIAGEVVADRQNKFRLVLGPLSLEQDLRFTPRGRIWHCSSNGCAGSSAMNSPGRPSCAFSTTARRPCGSTTAKSSAGPPGSAAPKGRCRGRRFSLVADAIPTDLLRKWDSGEDGPRG